MNIKHGPKIPGQVNDARAEQAQPTLVPNQAELDRVPVQPGEHIDGAKLDGP